MLLVCAVMFVTLLCLCCPPRDVDAVDGERQVCVVPLHLDIVPEQVIQPAVSRGRHLALAGAQVNPHLRTHRRTDNIADSTFCHEN